MIDKRSHTIAIINNALQHKIDKINSNFIDKNIINILYRYGIVLNISNLNNKFLVKINNKNFENIKLINLARKHAKIYLSPIQITKLKLHMQESLYIFSSAEGFCSQHDLIKKNISGYLVFQIVRK